MSKPRYYWWDFMKKIVTMYPERKKELQALRAQKITASISGMPRPSGESREVENLASRCLPYQEQKEHDAVMLAIKRTKNMPDGKLRMAMVRLTLWGNYNIAGAAMQLNISERTAKRYRWQFILLVGRMCGYLTEEQYRAAVKKDNPP